MFAISTFIPTQVVPLVSLSSSETNNSQPRSVFHHWLHRAVILAWACVFIGQGEARAQSSWLDDLSRALPRAGGSSFGSPIPSLGYNPGSTSFTPSSSLVSGRRDWRLGVNIQNNELGAFIATVAPGSAAQQAGLAPSDIIVSVGPARLGIVDGRVVELAEELRRYTDNFGRVNLLVFDSRTRSLRNVAVTMTSTANAVSGQVAIRDGFSLPVGASLAVQLQNATRPFFEVAGGRTVIPVQGFGPFAFELNVDPRYIAPSDQYDLVVSIVVGNQVVYGMSQPARLNANNLMQPLNITLERVNTGGFNPSGTSVNAAYPTMYNSTDSILLLFQQLLGRQPSNAELIGWQGYLQQGNSLEGMKARLLASNQFRERYRDDSVYMQNMIAILTGRTPNQQELSFWLSRLQATGSTDIVIREITERR